MKLEDCPVCDRCGMDMIPVYYTEEETKVEYGHMFKTGRKRRAVSHFTCPICGKNACVDDTFDGPWYS